MKDTCAPSLVALPKTFSKGTSLKLAKKETGRLFSLKCTSSNSVLKHFQFISFLACAVQNFVLLDHGRG